MKAPKSLNNVGNGVVAHSVAGLALLVSGCAERALEPAEPSAAIALQVTGNWAAAYEAAETDALAALYAEDASLYRSYGPTIRGRGPIRDHLAGALNTGYALNLQVSEAYGEGNVLFVQGEYAVVRPDGS